MSTFFTSFAHDLFPTVASFQAFSFVRRPVLAKMEQKKHASVGATWGYPCLLQASVAQGTTRAGVQEQHAQANDIANFDGEQFQLGYFPPGYKGGFEISEFDMKLTAAAGGVPDGAYIENFAVKMKEQPKEFGQRQEGYFIGKSGKSLGLSTANGTSSTLSTTNLAQGRVQLANRLMIGRFRLAMIVNISLAAGATSTDALLGSGNDQKMYIRNMDKDNGRLYVSDTSGGALGHAALDTAATTNAFYLFNYTDFQASGGGYSPNAMPPGVQDWIPSTAFDPASAVYTTAFQGVTRSRHSGLAGWRFAMTAGDALDTVIIQCLEEAFAIHGAEGTYTVPMSPRRWTQLTQIAAARGYRMLTGETATIGYRYIEIVHGDMKAECVSCPSMDTDDLFFLKMEDDGWCIRYLGESWPEIVNGDGMEMRADATDDKYSYRTNSFFHYGCRGINLNGRVDISSIGTT